MSDYRIFLMHIQRIADITKPVINPKLIPSKISLGEVQMSKMSSNMSPTSTNHHMGNIDPGDVVNFDQARQYFRPVKNKLKNTNYLTQLAQSSAKDSPRIKALKEDLLYFRRMLDQMVQQPTEKKDFRTSIIKSCNSMLGNNYRKMHKKYIDLLNKTQALEAEMHLRALEAELASLMQNGDSHEWSISPWSIAG